MRVARIAILHPGEMGAAVGGALRDAGHEVFWRPAGRSPATHQRASEFGLLARDSVTDCDIVISICPPASALAVAASIGGFRGIYVDANAVSPDTARAVAESVRAAGADYVDGGLIGPPPDRGTTHFYLSGARAAHVAAVFGATSFDTRVLEQSDFAASSLKMVYATATKISTAIVLAARATAAELGVEDDLAAEWTTSQPDFERRYQGGLLSAAAKGWRWEDEMRQIAQTFAAVGQPDGFGTAAAEVFGSWPRPA